MRLQLHCTQLKKDVMLLKTCTVCFVGWGRRVFIFMSVCGDHRYLCVCVCVCVCVDVCVCARCPRWYTADTDSPSCWIITSVRSQQRTHNCFVFTLHAPCVLVWVFLLVHTLLYVYILCVCVCVCVSHLLHTDMNSVWLGMQIKRL